MDIRKVNTNQLQFDPLSFEFISEIRQIPEFDPRIWPGGPLTRKEVYTYIVLMYDLKCNMRKLLPNFWHRKRVTAQTAGFKLGSNQRFDDVVEEMLLGLNDTVNRMVVRYVTMFNEPSYLTLVSVYEMFIQEATMAQARTDSVTKRQIIANITTFNKDIKELTEELFGGDEVTGYRKELYKTALSEVPEIRPEMISQKIRNEEQSVPVVYDNEENPDA